MEVLQTRVPKKTIEQIDAIVQQGNYSSRSDVVRHAIRMLMFQSLPRTKLKGNPVKLSRQAKSELEASGAYSYEKLKRGM